MTSITWQLIRKDWDISRLPMFGYAALAVVALVLVAMATGATFYVGSTMLITVVVVIGIHLIFVSVVHERGKQTLPFIMSLPISFMQYTRAKMLANLGIFGIAWLLIAAAVIAIFSSTATLPNGMLPFSLIILGELFVANILILGVAMVTESEAWTIVVMAFCNLCISLFIYFVGSIPEINAHMQGPVAVWNSTAMMLIGLEILAACVLIALIFVAQARKHDYL